MLLYPEKLEERLEVVVIRESIRSLCSTNGAQRRAIEAKPLSDFQSLKEILDQTAEMIRILQVSDKPSQQFEEMTPFFKKLQTKGTVVAPEELLIIMKSLSGIYNWSQFLKKNQQNYPNLVKLTYGFISNRELAEFIEQKIDERGELRPDATPELKTIRNEIVKSESKVRNSIKKVLEKVKKNQFTEEDSEVTIREGRLVIPIRAEHKRKIPGFVHDESSTGQTVFMEPTEVLDLNNEVRELQYREKREVQRILLELSDLIRTELKDIKKGAIFLELIDYLCAKAQFASKNDAVIPKLIKTPSVSLLNAYHPVLKQLNQNQKKETVPLSLDLKPDANRVLVISGPNAGGKSVAMKTVGLLQYMLQCGFPVTCDEQSVFGVFHNFFVDIGDSQSLENDLSTYSSRLMAMKYFMDFSDKKTLVLMDEFGSGTEPEFGGAIAEAVLNKIVSLKSYGVITTHYANIKKFAENTEGLVNGAMTFDMEHLEPLYRLTVGKPGSSFALEIAKKSGLSNETLSWAKKKIGGSHVAYDQMLNSLEAEKTRYEKLNKDLLKKEKDLKEIRGDYESLKKMLESERKKIIKQAKEEASHIISGANQKIEKVVREIKESKADKARTRAKREEIEQLKAKLTDNEKPLQKKVLDFKVGDKVTLEGQDTVGEVIQMNKKSAIVSFGSLKSSVDVSRLVPISNRKAKQQAKKRIGGLDINTKMSTFKPELDVRGRRVEEVITLVNEFIDNALLLGMSDLRIVHGKGHGVLREVIRTHLNNDPNIARYGDEHVEMGGAGVTLIELK